MKDKYWKSEYEYLRRKKNKQIKELEMKLSKGSHLMYEYLSQKGLLEEYMQWVPIVSHKRLLEGSEKNKCQITITKDITG